MSFEFDLKPKRLSRRERREVHEAFTGVAGPYGEVTVTVTAVPQRAELSSASLPPAWIHHPDVLRDDLVWIDDATRLVVAGQEARLTQTRRALGKADRALRIRLGDRHYTYLATGMSAEELHEEKRGPLIRVRYNSYKNRALTVLPEADARDLSLGLILQGARTDNLTLTGAIISGVWRFLDSGRADI